MGWLRNLRMPPFIRAVLTGELTARHPVDAAMHSGSIDLSFVDRICDDADKLISQVNQRQQMGQSMSVSRQEQAKVDAYNASKKAEDSSMGKPMDGLSDYGMSQSLGARAPRDNDDRRITFVYRNWHGVVRERVVIPIEIAFTTDGYHRELQWLMHAYDMGKGARRTFALKDMLTPIKRYV